jgi:hypothetical protein
MGWSMVQESLGNGIPTREEFNVYECEFLSASTLNGPGYLFTGIYRLFRR